MKRRAIALLAAVCLLLTGCGSWMDGYYVSVTPHMEQQNQADQEIEWIRDYDQLYDQLREMVYYGTQSDVFFVQNYNQGLLSRDINQVANSLKNSDPMGAYALENISFELGVNAGQSTIAVRIDYLRERAELLRIQQVRDTEAARKAIGSAMSKCSTELVMYIENYQDADFEQMAEVFAMENPDVVMEIPKVTAAVYPETGDSRVVELLFTYQTNRESLRDMQSSVESFFRSAEGYVSGDESAYEKYNHLYIMLMQRYNYKLNTSITPTYSLLRHGVGDSKAFATVYAAMCRQVGLDCLVVSGTRDGEPWFWNIVSDEGIFFHVDLYRCDQEDGYVQRGDDEMSGYVWDYSAYPACGTDSADTSWPEMQGSIVN